MRFVLPILFGAVAFLWIFFGLRVAFGAMRLIWLKDISPSADDDCPSVSVIFAARDEADKLPGALATLLKLDYPGLEIIAVDDRSTDETARLLDEFAARDSKLKVIHVSELPAGWLGKTHALQMGFERSRGEWLVFTDADVRFKADTLRRAVTLMRKSQAQHLTLLCDVEMVGFWEKTLVTFFGMAFQMATDPHRVSDPNSRAYLGVGAFQMVERKAYEAAGTHRRLAMEVVDDMKLGKIIKQSGFRSSVGIARDYVIVRWHAGLGNLVRGVTKNFFAGSRFSVGVVLVSIFSLLIMNVAPFAGVIWGAGITRGLAAASVAIALVFHGGVAKVMRVSPLYAFTHPLGAFLLAYMLMRSTVITLKQGGIVWRGTFYPLEELRRGLV